MDTAWSGSISGTTVASPVTVAGDINVLDVADVAVVLGGLDRPAAIGFVAGLFGFDPETPARNGAVPRRAGGRERFPDSLWTLRAPLW